MRKMEVFPGGIAGASLKPLRPVLSARRAMLVFPGGIAGASLKPRVGARPRASDHHVFPGGIAGASLKREVHGVLFLYSCLFSPAESPGPH